MKNKFLLIALALAFLQASLSAKSDVMGNAITCFGDSLDPMSNYDSPLIMATAIVAAIVAVAYMAGNFFEKPEINVWAKAEAITLVWSVVLIACVFAAFFFSCNLSVNIAQLPAGVSPAKAAGTYLERLSDRYGTSVAVELVQDSIKDQFNSMPYAYWGFPWNPNGGGGVAYLSSQRAWSANREILSSIYIPLMMSIKAQKMALDALVLGVAGMLLPAGLLLRMFFFSRDAGNFLIALAFSIYFFVPLTYLLCQQASDSVIGELGGSKASPFGAISIANDAIVGDAYQQIGYVSTQAILIPNIMLVILITSTMAINKGLKGLVG